MKYIDEALIYCDGGCKPNPGIMVGAFLITDGENILKGPVGNNFGEGTNIARCVNKKCTQNAIR